MNNRWKAVFLVSLVALVLSLVLTTSTFGMLNTTRRDLTVTQGQLVSTQDELANTVSELHDTKTELTNTQAQLNTSKIELTNVGNQLSSIRNELANVKIQLQMASDENSRLSGENGKLIDSYGSLRDKIDVRFGSTQADRQSFITPSDATVASKAQEVTSGYSPDTNGLWRGYESLYRWVVNNIDYSYDSYTPLLPASLSGTLTWRKEFWRMPAETLTDKAGDCEDMALLLASMMKNFNKGSFIVWLISISSSTPGVSGHMAVAFPIQGGQLTILDPAGNYYTGIRSGSLRSDSASVAMSDWLSHWAVKIQGAYVDGVFAETIDQEFKSTAEFLIWSSQR
jgi:hypothetical protein